MNKSRLVHSSRRPGATTIRRRHDRNVTLFVRSSWATQTRNRSWERRRCLVRAGAGATETRGRSGGVRFGLLDDKSEVWDLPEDPTLLYNYGFSLDTPTRKSKKSGSLAFPFS